MDDQLENYYDSQTELPDGGWPGDGSGTDDFADMNANEADDYRDEGDYHDIDQDFSE